MLSISLFFGLEENIFCFEVLGELNGVPSWMLKISYYPILRKLFLCEICTVETSDCLPPSMCSLDFTTEKLMLRPWPPTESLLIDLELPFYKFFMEAWSVISIDCCAFTWPMISLLDNSFYIFCDTESIIVFLLLTESKIFLWLYL